MFPDRIYMGTYANFTTTVGDRGQIENLAENYDVITIPCFRPELGRLNSDVYTALQLIRVIPLGV